MSNSSMSGFGFVFISVISVKWESDLFQRKEVL